MKSSEMHLPSKIPENPNSLMVRSDALVCLTLALKVSNEMFFLGQRDEEHCLHI